MPSDDLAPGVFIEEIPSGSRTIAGVATSITAFVGRTLRGPLDALTAVLSFADFERLHGGLAVDCPLSYAVRHFFLNGGGRAVIARIVHRDATGALDESAPITDTDLADPALEAEHRGLWLLDQADLFNLLCIPPLSRATDVASSTWNTAITYARQRRAFVIVDPPAAWDSAADALGGLDQLVLRDPNAALYFPRLLARDPLNSNLPGTFAPCGAVAGVYARTDVERGVWKAPAGAAATLTGAAGLSCTLSDTDNDLLNPLAINALRTFAGRGTAVWGTRTLAGADHLGSDWKYVPVRRLALLIEDSLFRGTQWAVFEPNAEPLWSQLRLNIGTFLHGLFRQGAFQGASPKDAYFVKCDAATTTQDDIDTGIVNIMVGFAPLKPAEFVVLRIRQLAGQGTASSGSTNPTLDDPLRADPYPSFNFVLELEGQPIAGFSEVSGLDAAADPACPDGSEAQPGVRKLPGLHKVTHLTLKRGVANCKALYDWHTGVSASRRPATAVLRDEAGHPVRRWQIANASIRKIVGPTLHATGNDVAIEFLELTHEGISTAK